MPPVSRRNYAGVIYNALQLNVNAIHNQVNKYESNAAKYEGNSEGRVHVGICRLTLHLPGSTSLKEKRQIARSLTDRVRNRFNVAVAEVDDADLRQRLTLGFSCVSNERSHADAMLSRVLDFVEESRLDVEVVDVQTEVVSGV